MYAVIKTGGKQYQVAVGEMLEFEKIEGNPGESVAFDQVLMVRDDDSIRVGTPLVKGATVTGTIIAQKKGPKITVFKMKRRKGYRKKAGHRQQLTRLRITEIAG
ncbi:MAG: 50S ribosomal protein L21 [Syntrophales bacterium]|jgi:large subunit ribosomal protein L21|nr:50S ribosomal protein L21 [Syntrophales bacterium]MCK9527102.1 50S ribosomal protein L21 [Syntrophales bacterium]MDX9921773.1 50S ribosomal protein L21 [Syntrophales bacterium]